MRIAAAALVLLGAASVASIAAEWTSADARSVTSYRLDIDKVRTWVDASRSLSKALEADPRSRERLRHEQGDNESIATMAFRLESEPVAAAAIRAAGLTGREYVLVMLALVQSSLAVALLDEDPEARVPAEVNPANLDFVRSHRKELEALRELLAPSERDVQDGEEPWKP